MTELFGSTFGAFLSLFLLVWAILWFLLPFAVFGIKGKLDELIAESKKTNEQLRALGAENIELKSNNEGNDSKKTRIW